MSSDSSPADTPLLLIAWRRPHTLRQLLDAIRPIAPTHLFVACDGPNPEHPGEAEKVAATRHVIEHGIDWPCQIERLYSDVNQGCRLGVSSAITWFFEQVEEGIILEDDCIPHPDFFLYCTTLLERYRHDTRVWCISGNNFQNGHWRGDASYYFSRIPLIWGWATWRRCWHYYDADMNLWPALRDSNHLQIIFNDPIEKKYWSGIWQNLLNTGMPNTWDYQWCFTCVANGGLCAEPNRNLVANIGFGEDATHTTGFAEPTLVDQGIPELKHPQFVLRDEAACRYCFDHKFDGAAIRRSFQLLPALKIRAKLAFRNPLHCLRRFLQLFGIRA
jgi:hypothetical protein